MAVSVFGLGLIGLLVTFGLVWTSMSLERATAAVVRDTKSRAVASELEVALLTYQRLSNLYVLSGDAELDATRRELAARMHSFIAQGEQTLGSAPERQLLEGVSRYLPIYLEERENVERAVVSIADAMQLTQPALNEVVSRLAALRDLNDVQVLRAHAEAQRANRLANSLGAFSLVVLGVGAAIIVLGVRRYLLRPILDLHAAIIDFQGGDLEARSSEQGLREVSELGHAFNEMRESLSRQRQNQLTFLAGVAHDLRNPMHGLKIGICSLAQQQCPEKRDELRERLDCQLERLARMVDDLLDATRIEAGQLELKIEQFDLRQVVREMIALYAPTSPGHAIIADIPDEPVMMSCDPLRVEQVVSNLLSNAIKYSPGGGQISITLHSTNGMSVLSVADRGVGIGQEDLRHLFQPFRRHKKDIDPGAGLGLSVVRRIVKAHGGQIEVHSELGVGSTFTVKLPLIRLATSHPDESMQEATSWISMK